jgi:putative oxidoreductase
MNTILWLLQGLLALVFLGSGALKLLLPRADLSTHLAWVASVPSWLPPFIGLLEVLGALGLILPLAMRVVPALTRLTAALLAVLMALAVGLHAIRGELALGMPALVLACLCVFVVIGRRN